MTLPFNILYFAHLLIHRKAWFLFFVTHCISHVSITSSSLQLGSTNLGEDGNHRLKHLNVWCLAGKNLEVWPCWGRCAARHRLWDSPHSCYTKFGCFSWRLPIRWILTTPASAPCLPICCRNHCMMVMASPSLTRILPPHPNLFHL